VAPQPPAPVPKPTEIIPASAIQTAAPPAPVQAAAESDPLVLVAECLEADDPRGAALHLDGYVRAHPDQLMFRLQLAELYLRTEQVAEAKFHFERFEMEAQTGPATVRPYLVTAHTKLMEIAQRRNDRFGELFHRGAGLFLLVKQQDEDNERDQALCEEMLCKALKALQDAKERKPNDPRVRFYLAQVYECTGNRHAAEAERAGTRLGVVSGGLTATERPFGNDE
jgi:predicted Zn-dependent protease